MPSQYLGTAIRELRKKKNMTLDQLADGICSKRQLQRIETNQTVPSAALLAQISRKLNEHITELYAFSGCKDPLEAYALGLQLQSLYNNGQYEEMHKACLVFLEKYPELPPEVHQTFGYCVGYSAFQSGNIENPDISYYEELLQLTLPPMPLEEMCKGYKTLNEIRLLTLLISEKFFGPPKEEHAQKRVEDYKEGFHLFDILLSNYLSNYTNHECSLLLDLYLGCSLFSYLSKDYSKALDYCNKGITNCLSKCNSLHLASAYGFKSEILYALGDEKEAKLHNEYFEILHDICDLSTIRKGKTDYFYKYFTL